MSEKKSEWVIRCPGCGEVRPYPGIRIGAASVGKRILAICTQCRGLKWVHVEREGKAAS